MFYRIFILMLLLCCGSVSAQVRIDIDGAPGYVEENIRNHIGAISDAERERPRLLRTKLTEAIRNATQALGFYETTFRHRLRDNTLSIDIDLGPEVKWQTAQIQLLGAAADLKQAKRFVQNAPFIADTMINHSSYENFKRELLEICQQHGFLDAHYVESRLIVDVEQHRANVVLKIDGGERYRFGGVDFSGSGLSSSLLERLSPIEPGSYYDKTQLTKFQRNLQDSRYFRG